MVEHRLVHLVKLPLEEEGAVHRPQVRALPGLQAISLLGTGGVGQRLRVLLSREFELGVEGLHVRLVLR